MQDHKKKLVGEGSEGMSRLFVASYGFISRKEDPDRYGPSPDTLGVNV